MRAYFFGNFYLSSIQQGIQAQHCTAEMFLKYAELSVYGGKTEGDLNCMLYDWAENHKTSILLNGGDDDGLEAIRELMYAEANPYPWAYFKESKAALNKALTCVGIILPERIYESKMRSYVRAEDSKGVGNRIMWHPENKPDPLPTSWEWELVLALNNCGMAR